MTSGDFVGQKGWGYIGGMPFTHEIMKFFVSMLGNGFKIQNSSEETKYGAPFTKNDIIACEFDFDSQEIEFFKNGVSQGVAFTNLSGSVHPAVSIFTNGAKISIPTQSVVGNAPEENGTMIFVANP